MATDLRCRFFAVAVLVARLAGAQPQYSVRDIGALPGYSASFGMRVSDSGWITGTCGQPGTRAFLWSALGGMVDLGPLANSQPGAVNALGLAVGGFGDPNTEGWQYLPGSGTSRLQSFGPYNFMHGTGCNDAGAIAGSGAGLFAPEKAVLWVPGQAPQDLGALPGHSKSQAWDVNAGLTVVGVSFDNNGVPQAFVKPLGQSMAKLPPGQGCNAAWARRLCDNGDVLGDTFVYGGLVGGPCLWHQGQCQTLAGLGRGGSLFYTDLNEAGWAVGSESTAFKAWALVRSPQGAVFALGDRIDPRTSDSWQELDFAYGLNDKGWITGMGRRVVSGQVVERAFIAIPERAPEPARPHG